MTTAMCACCAAHGIETTATTTAPAIVNKGGRFVRTGEELPSCESCRAVTLGALGEEEPAVTDDQIRSLAEEAAEHGDREQLLLCLDAIEGDADARRKCAEALAAAAAMNAE